MEKIDKSESLVIKIASVFLIFTIITIAISSYATFINQTAAYEKECETNIRQIGSYLSELMTTDKEMFKSYQEYYMAHFAENDIPYDVDEYLDSYVEYHDMINRKYPGRTLGKNLSLNELDEETQKMFFRYYHVYWMLTFESACREFDLAYTYYLVPKESEYRMVFMIDGERSEKNTDGSKKEEGDGKTGSGMLYLGDEYYDDPQLYPVMWEAWFSGRRPEGYQVWDNTWGHTYAYYTPLIIDGVKLGLIGTEVNVDKVNNTIIMDVLTQMAAIALTLVICMILMLLIIYRRYISRISSLEISVRDYTFNKDPAIADKIETSVLGRDEISLLSIQTAILIRDLEKHIKYISDMSAEKERIGTELKVATKIQSDMLPTQFPERSDLELYATMTPAKEVGGDFYDFFMLDDNHLALVIADVSGKGIPAALFMIMSKILIRNTSEADLLPSKILEEVNGELCENNTAGMFVTAWLGILTISTGKLTFANAGHEYPALKRANGMYELLRADNCPPLSVMEDMTFTDDTITLGAGDDLFLYTDGVPEAKDPGGRRFGTDRMISLLNEYSDLSPKMMLETLKEKIIEFDDSEDLFDDVTMMRIKYIGK
ncbi:MAG: PP2C family protein-serine/threonine phosphatase [Ruminiclostridium sp.]|nr:PP2C family protein-serine/threonine phosphatase [Ruminiclostridium sp.]